MEITAVFFLVLDMAKSTGSTKLNKRFIFNKPTLGHKSMKYLSLCGNKSRLLLSRRCRKSSENTNHKETMDNFKKNEMLVKSVITVKHYISFFLSL